MRLLLNCIPRLLLLFIAPAAMAQDVLFVVNETGNVEGNQSVIDRLTENFGFNVTVIDDDDPRNPQAADATDMVMVIISSTVLSSNVGTAFTDQDAEFRAMEIPIIQWESALHDEYLFTDSGRGVDTDTILITEDGASHPLAAGLTAGEHVVRDATTPGFHVGSVNNVAEGYFLIGEVDGDPALGVVEAGGVLNDGTTTASARRIDIFFGDGGLLDVNDAGLALFDAAVNYALGTDLNVTLGDFNSDGAINLDDFNILVANFNTRRKSFPDGDMDFNRRIDLADFNAFREVFNAQPEGQAQAVPEPASCVLAVFGTAFLFLLRRKGGGRASFG